MSPRPKYVRTAAEFSATVRLKETPESQVLEFKSEVDKWNLPKGTPDHVKKEAQKETCRDIVQFANTFGGCLLVGINETTANGLQIADGVKAVADAHALRGWIGEAIKNYVVPNTFNPEIVAVPLPQGTILAVNVPPSVDMVSLWDRDTHTIEYPYRTSHGKAWMNPDEAERHLMNASRAAKLNLLAVIDGAPQRRDVEVVGGFWFWGQNSGGQHVRLPTPSVVRMGTTDDVSFVLHVTIGETPRTLTLPYGAVKEAWLADAKINLLLSVRPLLRNETLTVDPYP